jgi:hypothetical protein
MFVLVVMWGTLKWRWLRHCARRQKAFGSVLDEVIKCFQFTISLQPHYGPGVYSGSNRNGNQKMFLEVKSGRRKADNLTAFCEPTVYKM